MRCSPARCRKGQQNRSDHRHNGAPGGEACVAQRDPDDQAQDAESRPRREHPDHNPRSPHLVNIGRVSGLMSGLDLARDVSGVGGAPEVPLVGTALRILADARHIAMLWGVACCRSGCQVGDHVTSQSVVSVVPAVPLAPPTPKRPGHGPGHRSPSVLGSQGGHGWPGWGGSTGP